jgi:hypothetical protein
VGAEKEGGDVSAEKQSEVGGGGGGDEPVEEVKR